MLQVFMQTLNHYKLLHRISHIYVSRHPRSNQFVTTVKEVTCWQSVKPEMVADACNQPHLTQVIVQLSKKETRLFLMASHFVATCRQLVVSVECKQRLLSINQRTRKVKFQSVFPRENSLNNLLYPQSFRCKRFHPPEKHGGLRTQWRYTSVPESPHAHVLSLFYIRRKMSAAAFRSQFVLSSGTFHTPAQWLRMKQP